MNTSDDTEMSSSEFISSLSDKYKLDKKEISSLKAFAKNKACFVAGTISPTSSISKEPFSLEPLSTGLNYYKNNGISKLSLQTKFMGSRLQIYLFDNLDDSFAITRNGYETSIENSEIQDILSFWWHATKNQYNWKNSIILDGELLPWKFFGQGLIEQEFVPYSLSLQNELYLLKNDSFFNNLQFNKKPDLLFEDKHLTIFDEQLSLFAQDSSIEFKLFQILKMDDIIYPFQSHEVINSFFSNEQFPNLIINLEDSDSYDKANDFFINTTQNLQHEGIIIKPIVDTHILVENKIAPSLKVRNENYLHLIYGHDFLQNYPQFCLHKKTKQKVESSILQFKLGYRMLQSNNPNEILDLFCRIQSNNKTNIDLTL